MNEILEELDSTWIEEFDNLDKEYKDYYREELSFTRCHFIYINKENEIEKITELKLFLKTPGVIQKEELMTIIKQNIYFNNIKYRLMSILNFNINFDPVHLKTFLNSSVSALGDSYLQTIQNIDTIRLDKSISIFHDINDLFILFYEKTNKTAGDPITRRLASLNTNKKTKRKLLKETTL